jgi:Zn-dependent M28 family amino/carboxypeptidase
MVFMAFNGEEKGMLGSRAISEDKTWIKSITI